MARQWLPELFRDVEIDPERLKVRRRAAAIEVQITPPAEPADPREDQALALLEDDRPRRRVRGLALLEKIGDADLADWCAVFLADDAPAVRVAALRALRRCDDADGDLIVPLARSDDKRVRAAAVAALARHGGREAARWFERGLKDPSACVRLETAAVLEHLDPTEHRRVFELALYDPNPQVAYLAEKLTAGKGYHKQA